MERHFKRACGDSYGNHRLAINHFTRATRHSFTKKNCTINAIYIELYNRCKQSNNRALSCIPIYWPTQQYRFNYTSKFAAAYHFIRAHHLRKHWSDLITRSHSVTHQIKLSHLDTCHRLRVCTLRSLASSTRDCFCSGVVKEGVGHRNIAPHPAQSRSDESKDPFI